MITDVRVRLADGPAPLKAYCRFVVGGFVVCDAKLILCPDGRYIVSMPSRKAADRCGVCHTENPLKARYCGWCGDRLGAPEGRVQLNDRGKAVYHHDLVFPTCPVVREEMTAAIVEAYEAELTKGDG